jgi:hypothetical protein
MSKQVDFILHKCVDKWDMVNPSIFSWTERAPMIGCEVAERRHLARDALVNVFCQDCELAGLCDFANR